MYSQFKILWEYLTLPIYFLCFVDRAS